MNDNRLIASYIKDIFDKNWNQLFVFDALNNTQYTYDEFINEVFKFKSWLQSLNLKKDEVLCLIMNNSIELLLLYFASLLLKLRVVPIDPLKGKQDIYEIISQIEHKKIISNTNECNYIENIIWVDDKLKRKQEKGRISIKDLNYFDSLDYTREFLITFTSGSTGIPKGVVHSFSNLFKTALAFAKKFNFNQKHIFYHNLPMTYMAGILNQIILPFLCKSQIVIGERFTISAAMRFWEYPIKYNVNVFWFIPTIVSLLTKLDRGTQGINYAKKIQIIGCCGTAPLSAKSKKEFENKYNIKLYESYGLSETLFVSTNYPGNDHFDSVGLPLDGIELKFIEENEIIIKAPWNLLKYANFDIKEYLIENYFLSGDIGLIDTNGLLSITDRKKDLIIRGGVNISPKKIHDFLSKYNFFEEIVILGVEDQIFGEKILCVYVPNQNYKEEHNKILNRDLIEQLGQDYQIDDYFKMDTIPKNVNGKIDKLTIKKLYHEKNL